MNNKFHNQIIWQ